MVGTFGMHPIAGGYVRTHACNCVGPKNGQPLCPCQMKSVEVRDGRYILIQDLGPVRKYDDEFITTTFGEI